LLERSAMVKGQDIKGLVVPDRHGCLPIAVLALVAVVALDAVLANRADRLAALRNADRVRRKRFPFLAKRRDGCENVAAAPPHGFGAGEKHLIEIQRGDGSNGQQGDAALRCNVSEAGGHLGATVKDYGFDTGMYCGLSGAGIVAAIENRTELAV